MAEEQIKEIRKIAEIIQSDSQPVIISIAGNEQHLVIENLKANLSAKLNETIIFDPSEGIKILRECLNGLGSRSLSGGLKLLVIMNSQNLTAEEGNTLLKVMEEPSKYSRILLLTSSVSKILATIKSRAKTLALVGSVTDNSEGLYSVFEKGDFNDLLKSISRLENEDFATVIKDTLDEIKKIGLNEGREVIYRELSKILIKIESSNSNPKLSIENLFVLYKSKATQ